MFASNNDALFIKLSASTIALITSLAKLKVINRMLCVNREYFVYLSLLLAVALLVFNAMINRVVRLLLTNFTSTWNPPCIITHRLVYNSSVVHQFILRLFCLRNTLLKLLLHFSWLYCLWEVINSLRLLYNQAFFQAFFVVICLDHAHFIWDSFWI